MPSTATSILDGLSTSVAVKAPCRTVATSNITLSGLQTISGYTTAENDRVLVKGQDNAVDNGIYNASTGNWTRAKDADGNRDFVQGTRVIVRSPTIAGAEYELTTANPVVIGTSALTFELRYGANATYDQTEAEISAAVTIVNDSKRPGDLLRYGENSIPGTTNMTAAFTAARAVTSGRYHIPAGTYLVDPSPDVWADAFTADGDTELIISSTTYDISNAFAGRLRYRAASNVKLDIVDAVTGNIVLYLQNSAPGTATGFYRGLAFTTDSHYAQAQPATNGGSVDFLFQRSTLNADASGNRFSYTFDEANDRWQFSHATTASGAPSFDMFMEIVAGPSGTFKFPALQPQFNQGWSVKRRASGGLELEMVVDATSARIRNKGTPANINISFGDNAIGFLGASAQPRPTVSGSRGGNAALQSLLTALANLGLITDSTS